MILRDSDESARARLFDINEQYQGLGHIEGAFPDCEQRCDQAVKHTFEALKNF